MSPLHGPGEILPASAAQYGDKVALVTETRTLSFNELDELSTRIASRLWERGIAPGDRVSIYAGNRWEWVVAYHGALKAGAVVNPINVMLTPEEVHFVLRDCASSALFASADKLEAMAGTGQTVEGLKLVVDFDGHGHAADSFEDLLSAEASTDFHRPAVLHDSPSTIGYTSGTTGHPKGAVQSQQAVLLNCESTAQMHGRTQEDVVISALPAPHVYGNVVINGTLLKGGTVVLMARFDAKDALALVARHRATLFEGVPAMYSMMLNDPTVAEADLSSITRSTVGGQTISTSVIEAWEKLTHAPMLELWGMTELAGLGATHWYDKEPVRGSIGVALPGLELRVADLADPHKDVEQGQPGELMARGPMVMLEYFGNPAATAEALETDGWLHTGDVAIQDEAGYFFIVDRRKDMIITSGYNIYPAEIERIIAANPAVAMVAVGSLPDPVKGEIACAYVVRREGTDLEAEQVLAYSREHLAAYKVPRKVVFVSSLPQTSTGKIMRRKLSTFGHEL
ncbi:class I adenylate-forming enzyme family protein [Paeniglutamicibacter sp. MACA_103]|uniref:class I adenylate-forming enzyme family protein n=1 Tax=Paeniglutamicibacter sp. MACA_103 TaxID=3377337 RepID=UPI003894C560